MASSFNVAQHGIRPSWLAILGSSLGLCAHDPRRGGSRGRGKQRDGSHGIRLAWSAQPGGLSPTLKQFQPCSPFQYRHWPKRALRRGEVAHFHRQFRCQQPSTAPPAPTRPAAPCRVGRRQGFPVPQAPRSRKHHPPFREACPCRQEAPYPRPPGRARDCQRPSNRQHDSDLHARGSPPHRATTALPPGPCRRPAPPAGRCQNKGHMVILITLALHAQISGDIEKKSMLRARATCNPERPPMQAPTAASAALATARPGRRPGGYRGRPWDSFDAAPMRPLSNINEPSCFDRTLPDANEKAGERELTGFHLHRVLVRPERFELPTAWFVARYSIQLSYGRIRNGILPESAYARQSFRLSCRRRSLVQNTEKPWKPGYFSEWRRVRDSTPR